MKLTSKQIKEEYAKIILDMGTVETKVVEALVDVYQKKIKELQEKCGQETGHEWYDIYYGLNRKCSHCKLIESVG